MLLSFIYHVWIWYEYCWMCVLATYNGTSDVNTWFRINFLGSTLPKRERERGCILYLFCTMFCKYCFMLLNTRTHLDAKPMVDGVEDVLRGQNPHPRPAALCIKKRYFKDCKLGREREREGCILYIFCTVLCNYCFLPNTYARLNAKPTAGGMGGHPPQRTKST